MLSFQIKAVPGMPFGIVVCSEIIGFRRYVHSVFSMNVGCIVKPLAKLKGR